MMHDLIPTPIRIILIQIILTRIRLRGREVFRHFAVSYSKLLECCSDKTGYPFR